MARPVPNPENPPQVGERREKLLRTVIRIVARDGIDALSFRSLADEANTSYGLAAYHFGSREEMLDQALLLCVRDHQKYVDATLAAETLDEFAEGVPELIVEIGDIARFQFIILLLSRRNVRMRQRVCETYESFYEAMGNALAEVGIPSTPDLAATVFAAVDGLVLQQFVYEDPERTYRALAELRRLLAALRTIEAE